MARSGTNSDMCDHFQSSSCATTADVQAILPVTVPMHQSVTIVVFQGELAAHVSYFVFEELLLCVPHKIPFKCFF
jgi:hypothetical protein